MHLHLFVRRTAIHAWLGFCSAVLGFSATADDLVRRPITFMSVERTKVAPKIDGDLDDLCWRETREIGGFQRTAGDRSKPVQFATTARLLFDDTHVYIAFECLEPDVAGPQGQLGGGVVAQVAQPGLREAQHLRGAPERDASRADGRLG